MKIEAKAKTFKNFKDYFFVVPDYQREYVWEADNHVEQFLIDIEYEFDEDSDEQNSYFIGSIIIVENNGKFDVIDGQQRLTTIMILLCALRDLLEKQNLNSTQKNHLEIIKSILFSFDPDTEQELIRLELQYDESKDYLTNLIKQMDYQGDFTPSIKKMEAAYESIKTHLNKLLIESVDKLVAYARYLVTHIDMVFIKSENLSSALKIFETINQRGVGLNAMDLVKNLLFSEAKPEQFAKIKDTWKSIIASLQSCNEDQSPLRFLRYFLMARYHDGILREDSIYSWTISKSGKSSLKYESNPLGLATELKVLSKRYAELVIATGLQGDGGNYPNVTNIGYMNKYKSRQHLVLLLALGTNCKTSEINYLALQIETFFMVSNTIGIQAKYNERLFADWASQFRGIESKEQIKSVTEKTILPYLKNFFTEYRKNFHEANDSKFSPLYRQRYVLGKYENYVRETVGLSTLSHSNIQKFQLEHILPQTAKNDNLTSEFEDIYDYENYVSLLGNITLLESTINQAVNNFNDLNGNWFDKKQSEYSNSDAVSTKLLNDKYNVGKNTKITKFKKASSYLFINWSKSSITSRQKILFEWSLNIWKLCGKRLDK